MRVHLSPTTRRMLQKTQTQTKTVLLIDEHTLLITQKPYPTYSVDTTCLFQEKRTKMHRYPSKILTHGNLLTIPKLLQLKVEAK